MNMEFRIEYLFVFVIIIVFIIIINNRRNQPTTCEKGKGLIYNNNDFGSRLGLGGFYCGDCDINNYEYVDDNYFCKKCSTGQYYENGKCISCPKGQKLDSETHKCVNI